MRGSYGANQTAVALCEHDEEELTHFVSSLKRPVHPGPFFVRRLLCVEVTAITGGSRFDFLKNPVDKPGEMAKFMT
ncbi:hypothetical protein CPT32_22430 [Rhizobium sophoriradicis]|nr:hypothetical protein CPT32_22430 [Rhizobium sophoriradicis]